MFFWNLWIDSNQWKIESRFICESIFPPPPDIRVDTRPVEESFPVLSIAHLFITCHCRGHAALRSALSTAILREKWRVCTSWYTQQRNNRPQCFTGVTRIKWWVYQIFVVLFSNNIVFSCRPCRPALSGHASSDRDIFK